MAARPNTPRWWAIAIVATLSAVTANVCLAGEALRDRPALRVCADPDDLPFTSDAASKPGFYLELAQRIADQLGRTVVPVWASTFAPERMLRSTLLAHRCDMFAGVPADARFMAPQVILSHPVLPVGYVLVSHAGFGMADLHGAHVAVQFGSPAQDFATSYGDLTPLTVMTADEGMTALNDGRVAAALLWGPSAGYLNRTRMGGRFRITKLAGAALQWQAAIGFAARNTRLRDQVDEALAGDEPFIHALAAKYGFPDDISLTGAQANPIDEFELPTITKGVSGQHRDTASANSQGPGSSISAMMQKTGAPSAAVGKSLFNTTCAHCHGPNAVEGERRINLRLLELRYGSETYNVFTKAVTQGRASKGMPNWRSVYSDDQFAAILAFLRTVQEKD